jgi:UDP-N-acetylglucosamine 2-epimerase (non-hydrolysing)
VAAEERDRRPLVVSVVGTRPEAIKMAPVVRALAERPALRQEVILTGQHSGLEDHFDLPAHAVTSLGINLREQTAGEIREAIHLALLRRFIARRPSLVLVQGDTSSAVGGALAAADCGVPIGHVEAGLRSGDLQQPWPEEENRILIDELSHLLFAPTEAAALNLAAEPELKGEVFVTGNSGVDALFHARLSCPAAPAPSQRKTILVTCHRRENQGAKLRGIARALERLALELPVEIVFVLHSNPHLSRTVERLLGGTPNITLAPPVEHREMVCLMERSWLILTDSGGIQEEGPALGRPVLVLRERTERGEALATENVELVGTDGNRIFAAVSRLLANPAAYARMTRPSFPFGDGKAAPRIAAIVETYLGAKELNPLRMAALSPRNTA